MLALEQSAEKWPFSAVGDRPLQPPPLASDLSESINKHLNCLNIVLSLKNR